MESKVLEEMGQPLTEAFGQKTAAVAMLRAQAHFDRLCEENAGENKKTRAQTRNNLYPCMALYFGLKDAKVEQERALAFLDRSWSLRAEPQAESIRRLMKLPGLYRLMPFFYKRMTLGAFGEEAGFRAKFYDLGKNRCKFDMTKCLFCDTCRKYGCPELVPCFCHTDDVTSGNMHPRIKWNRTKTMGEGGDVCDFDIIVTEK